jgi:hypothetical protein
VLPAGQKKEVHGATSTALIHYVKVRPGFISGQALDLGGTIVLPELVITLAKSQQALAPWPRNLLLPHHSSLLHLASPSHFSKLPSSEALASCHRWWFRKDPWLAHHSWYLNILPSKNFLAAESRSVHFQEAFPFLPYGQSICKGTLEGVMPLRVCGLGPFQLGWILGRRFSGCSLISTEPACGLFSSGRAHAGLEPQVAWRQWLLGAVWLFSSSESGPFSLSPAK